jgi:hypothetical protein
LSGGRSWAAGARPKYPFRTRTGVIWARHVRKCLEIQQALHRTRTDDPFLTMSARMQAAASRLRVSGAKSASRASDCGRLRVGSRRLTLPCGFHLRLGYVSLGQPTVLVVVLRA